MSDYEKWLNGEISDSDLSHRQYGAFQERSRIIKLVERFRFNEELGFSFEQAKEDLLTLIKGEK